MRTLLLDLHAGDPTVGRVDKLGEALAQEGHLVEVMTDPVAAGWLCAEADLDLALVCVPEVGAVLQWCRRLRRSGVWVPVLVLADVVEPPDLIGCLDAGADDCVSRPVTLGEISARARALGRRRPRERPTVLQVGDLRLDPAARRAWRGTTELALTPREFVLLQAFLEHPGQTLTRARLLDRAWDSSVDPVSNVVDQAIKHLRRRIDRPFGTHDLQTVRGVGYRLTVAASARPMRAAG